MRSCIDARLAKKRFFQVNISMNVFFYLPVMCFDSFILFVFSVAAALTFAIIILKIQYFFLKKYADCFERLCTFYLSFVAFCYSVNLVESLNHLHEFKSNGFFITVGGVIVRGGAFVIFGHLVCALYYLPLVVGVNYLLRDRFDLA